MIYMGKAQDDGSRNVLIAGVLLRDAKFEYTKNSQTPKVTFSVAYGKKQYMKCVALGDRPTTLLASGLEKGDVVLCAGIWTRREYTGADGAQKNWDELLCDYIAVQQVPNMAAHEGTEMNTPAYTNAAQVPFVEMDADDEDLPF